MAFSFATIPVLLTLLAHSYTDLRRRRVKDWIMLAGITSAVLVAAIQFNHLYVGKMIGQFLKIGFLAFLFRLVTQFGMGDVLSLALAGMVFPDIWFLRLMAWLVLPMWFWLKTWSLVKNTEYAPAVPGITIGYVLAMVTMQTF